MSPTEEIIAGEVIEQEEINPEGEEITQEDIDDLPEIDNDSLCDECKELGYCRLQRERETLQLTQRRKTMFLEDSTICNLIPISVEGEYYRHTGEYSKKHLQAAFEAFHQQDYETSVLNCQAVITENKTLAMPFLVIAVCKYFLGELAEAINQYEFYLSNIEYIPEEEEDKMKFFIWHCENKLRELINNEETSEELIAE